MSINVFEAVTLQDTAELESLIRSDPGCVNARDDDDMPPLYTAARHGNSAAIDVLLKASAKVDVFACCYLDRIEDGRLLLEKDPAQATVNSSVGLTPLHFAARKGSFEMAQLLIQHGADVNAADNDGNTPLLEAAHGGPWKPEADQSLITLLVDNGADVSFHTAAAIGRADLLELGARNEPDLNRLDAAGSTALYHAAHNNHLTCVEWLLEAGADANHPCDDGQTPLTSAALHLLSQQCDPDICYRLIAAGAPFDIHTAAALGDVERLKVLLAADVNLIKHELHGFSPADYAVHCGQLEALRTLLDHGADPSATDAYGDSLLEKTEHLPALHQLLSSYLV